jgi:hypothetical protein
MTPRKNSSRSAAQFSFALFLLLASHQAHPTAEGVPSPLLRTISALAPETPAPQPSAVKIAGETVFEVFIPHRGTARKWILDAAGVPLHVQLLESEIAGPIRAILQKEAGAGHPLLSLARTYEGGKVVYEAEVGTQANQTNITFSAEGKIISREISITALPQAVRRALNKRFQGAKKERCYRGEEDGDVFFTVTLPDPEKPRWITFDSDGDIEDETSKISLEELPAPVREAIQIRLHVQGVLGPEESVRVLKTTSEDGTVFEIWAFHEGKIQIFWVTPDGVVSDLAP